MDNWLLIGIVALVVLAGRQPPAPPPPPPTSQPNAPTLGDAVDAAVRTIVEFFEDDGPDEAPPITFVVDDEDYVG